MGGAARRPRATASREPACQTKATLSGASSHTAGAPGAERGRRGGDRGQRLVVDGDQLGGVGGRAARLGDHERDRIAHVTRAPAHQRGARRREGRRAVAPLAVRSVGRWPRPSAARSCAGEHREHAGGGERGRARRCRGCAACAWGERTTTA